MEGRQAGRRGEEKGQVMSWQKGWQQLGEEGQSLSGMRRGLMGESGHVAGCCGKVPNRQAILATRVLQGAYNINRTIWENTERSRDAEIFK